MDYSKFGELFDMEALSKLADVITPTATREEISEGAAKLGVSLSEEQLSGICELILSTRELSDDELKAVAGGKIFLYRPQKPDVIAGETDQLFRQFLKNLALIFKKDDQKNSIKWFF